METGSLKNKKRVLRSRRQRDNAVLRYFEEQPEHSINDAVRDLHHSFGLIQKILKRNKRKPYKYTPVQELTPQQINNRFEFSQYIVGKIDEDPNFLSNILWTDVATFTTGGKFNRQNVRYWSAQNPRRFKEIQRQGRQSIHVWCGLFKDRIIGPIIFDGNLNGDRYYNMLHNDIHNLIQEGIEEEDFIWQQDGAPPHNVRIVTNYLNTVYHEWFGKYGTTRWPPNSPDLTPLDTFLWGYLKTNVYRNRPRTLEEIRNRVVAWINRLNNHNYMIRNSLNNLKRRYRLCYENRGRHIEQLLN